MKTGRMLVAILVFTISCQTSKKDSQNAEPKAEEVQCGQELVLECEDGKIDRCSIFKTGNHECIEKPDDIVFKCSEVLGFHCPEGEVDSCTFKPEGNHECVKDPRLANDFPQACDKKEMLSCPKGQVDACELNSKAKHECVPHAKEYLVKFKTEQGLRLNAIDLPKQIAGAKTLGKYLKARLLHIAFDNIDVVTSAIELSKIFGRDDVEYVVENIRVKAIGTPNDTQYSDQWAHAKVGSPAAWEENVGDRSVVVAVVDTGVDYLHADLAANMYVNTLEIAGNGVDDDNNGYVDDYRGWDFYDEDNDPMDETSSSNKGHGTHCAGIIGAVGNNGIGVVGSSQQVSIMPVRFLGPKGEGGLAGAVKAIDYAVDNGADIISASFGVGATAAQVKPLLEAIERAKDAGVLFVAAASNDGKNNDEYEVYPANTPYSNVISVAASDQTDGKPSWSNYGKKVTLAAPGNEILSTLPGQKYGTLSGTSMAAPMVAGAAALLMAENRKLAKNNVATTDFAREVTSKPENIRSLLQASGEPVGINTSCNCRMNLGSAFSGLKGTGLFVSPASGHLVVGDVIQLNVFGGDGNYQLSSTAPTVVSVDNSGLLKAVAAGDAKVTVVDGQQRTVESFSYRISPKTGGGGGACPLEWPRVCSIVCYFLPTALWCG